VKIRSKVAAYIIFTSPPSFLMLGSVRKYVYDRRRGLFETSVVLCGAYAVSRYVNERLEEVKEKVVRERAAREAYAVKVFRD
jgi:peroxin-3